MTSIALFVSLLAILSLGINQALIVRRLQRHEAAVAEATSEMSFALAEVACIRGEVESHLTEIRVCKADAAYASRLSSCAASTNQRDPAWTGRATAESYADQARQSRTVCQTPASICITDAGHAESPRTEA